MWKFWIDTGGTFTDCMAAAPDGEIRRAKVLSSSCIRGLVSRRASERRFKIEVGMALPSGIFRGYGFRLPAADVPAATVVEWDAASKEVTLDRNIGDEVGGRLCEFVSPEEPPILAARLLTGTRLDEPLPPLEMRLATTRGTNALLERKGARVALLITNGFGDLLAIGNQQRPNLFEIGIQKPDPLYARIFEVDERMDADGTALRPLDDTRVERIVEQARQEGIQAFAIALLHSYRNPEHERRAHELLRRSGANFVSISSELSPYVKILPRAQTAVVDAYLAPIMDAYLDAVEQCLDRSRLRIMTSAGGLVSRDQYHPKDSLLSGPAGGVVGASNVGERAGFSKTIAFDMGGTSTDVSRYDGSLDYRFEQRIASVAVFAPTLRIETVAAGGGSLCWFDGAALRVGPESAGAHPGPACYGAGGPLALTDVNLLLGRLSVAKFGIPVFPDAARKRLQELKREVAAATGERPDDEALLKGFVDIANERMAEAIRKVSVGEGFDVSQYALIAFGGAGGLHACAIAELLEMTTILFPADAGLLSAYGLKVARVEQFAGKQVLQPLEGCVGVIGTWERDLESEAAAKLEADGVARGDQEFGPTRFELRFAGQESILTVEGTDAASLAVAFRGAYESQFGFLPNGLQIELVAIRVSARSRGAGQSREHFDEASKRAEVADSQMVSRSDLAVGRVVEGPQVIQDAHSTIFVETGWRAIVGSSGTVKVEKITASNEATQRSEVVELELFTNRFLSIVGEMGALLERAAFSTNVKERKDFSCALLDPDGFLVANAPHIPVHLGALGVCLRSVLQEMALEAGDVVVTNHPAFGGSHLPDVTLLAPVYSESGGALIGYVANRAHHAEIGGISPGSMPPNARNLAEEGVVIPPLKLVSKGRVDWGPVERLLVGAEFPTRSFAENCADLAAQLASIRRGCDSLQTLARNESGARVTRFMQLLKNRAAIALRTALKERELPAATAIERLDNGAEVRVTVSRDEEKWRIDFAGTAGVQPDNYNATPAVTTSAVIYVLRLLADAEVPLNEGFLSVVDIRIPEGMLNPRFHEDPRQCPAVVAGNVEVSQLVVSALLKAFKLAASSQSTMNNFIFGTEEFGYYETIAGGEGASAHRDGASGIHTHMTNTALTDPEIMELRYPVRVEGLSLRSGSGGVGLRRGGEGIVKRIRFLGEVVLSLLTQRRQEAPFGLMGGGPGACGEQEVVLSDGRRDTLPGNGSYPIKAGSVVEIRTPGGGGWGAADT